MQSAARRSAATFRSRNFTGKWDFDCMDPAQTAAGRRPPTYYRGRQRRPQRWEGKRPLTSFPRRHERSKARGSGLEHRAFLKRPRLVHELPVRVRSKGRRRVDKVRLMVRAKIEARPPPRAAGRRDEKIGLHQPVLVMPELRPGIGKEHKDRRQLGARWQRLEKHLR